MDPKLAVHIEGLAAPRREIQERSRSALRAAGRSAVPSLIQALGHELREVRAGAALLLGELGAREAASELGRMAGADPDPSVRPLALRALSDLACPGCDPALRSILLGHLKDEDHFARALACRGLGRINDEPCRLALEQALHDPEPWVSDAARKALSGDGGTGSRPGDLQEEKRREEVDPRTDTQQAMVPAASTLGQELSDLASLDPNVQQRARETLIRHGAQVLDRLAALLRDPVHPGRRVAAEVVIAIGDREGMEVLAEVLHDADLPQSLRAVVLHGMARIIRCCGVQPGFPSSLVQQHLLDPDAYVRAGATAALVASGGEDRLAALLAVLEDDDDWVRRTAAQALAGAAGPRDLGLLSIVIDLLSQATETPDQIHLLQVLARILDGPSPSGLQVQGPISFFLASKDPRVRRAAATLLARITDQPDRGLVQNLLQLIREDPGGSEELIRAVGRLTPAEDPVAVTGLRQIMLGPHPAAAAAAVTALTRTGGPEAVLALVEAANSRCGPVVASSAQALAALDPRSCAVGVRQPDGRWAMEQRFFCQCGGQLRFVMRQQREELRCPQCDEEYLLSPARKLVLARSAPFGACLCPGCRRKQPLVRRGETDVLVCPASGKVHVRPFDHLRQIRLLEELPLGACCCCAEPQPLIRINDEVLCYRSRRRYVAAQRGFVPEGEPPGPAAPRDVSAINRALLMGTLGLGQSGMVASTGQGGGGTGDGGDDG